MTSLLSKVLRGTFVLGLVLAAANCSTGAGPGSPGRTRS